MAQLFTSALDEVRRKEAADRELPKDTRRATLRNADGPLSKKQIAAPAALGTYAFIAAKAWRAKKMLRWIGTAKTALGARWRLTHFIRYLPSTRDRNPIMNPLFEALETVTRHKEKILARWDPRCSNARLEGLNRIFQAASAGARGYRNTETYIAMIDLSAAPMGNIVTPARND